MAGIGSMRAFSPDSVALKMPGASGTGMIVFGGNGVWWSASKRANRRVSATLALTGTSSWLLPPGCAA